jgi:uncharacterized membrane protein YeiH
MSTTMISLPPIIDTTAITVGALSGALYASRRGLDPIGVFLVAVCTGVGGGAVRDVLLVAGPPVFLVGTNFLAYASVAALIGIAFGRVAARFQPVYDVLDTLLIGLWVTIGVQKTLILQLPWPTVIFIGVVTATGGGLLRDVLLRERPGIFLPGQYYALAAFAAAIAYAVLAALGQPQWVCVTVCLLTATALRVASARYGLVTTPPQDLHSLTALPRVVRRTSPPSG